MVPYPDGTKPHALPCPWSGGRYMIDLVTLIANVALALSFIVGLIFGIAQCARRGAIVGTG